MTMKSETESEVWRIRGNELYRSGDFRDALVFYNRSLCYAVSSQSKSLAYANRSAVFYEVKKHKLCLDNISLAQDHGYPVDKMSKLTERKQRCKDIIKKGSDNSNIGPWNFFKLSYPANKKIPFIVDCLELKVDSKYGQHIITTRDLKPGDIISIEEPFIKHANGTNRFERCYNCFKTNFLSLLPCKDLCNDTMFCSKKCMKLSDQRHGKCVKSHDISNPFQKILKHAISTAGSLNKLQVLMLNSDRPTVFDFDMNNLEDNKTQLNCLLAYLALPTFPGPLEKFEEAVIDNMLSFESQLFSSLEECFLLQATIRQLGKIYIRNIESLTAEFVPTALDSSRFIISKQIVDSGVFLFGALISESCDPNINCLYVENKMVSVVQLPIKAGEKLSHKSCPDFLKLVLQRKIEECECGCDGCQSTRFQHLSRSFHNDLVDFMGILTMEMENLKMEDCLKELKEGCKEIAKKKRHHPSRETLLILTRNAAILFKIKQIYEKF